MRRSLLFPLLLAPLLLASCASFNTERNQGLDRWNDPAKGSTWALYLPNRVADLGDTVSGSLFFGPGTNIRVRATKYATAVWPDKSPGLALGWNTHWIDPIQKNHKKNVYWWRRFQPVKLGSHGGPDARLRKSDFDTAEIYQSPDTFGGGFQLLIIGGDLGVRPMEFIDFVGGFFMWDYGRDDVTYTKEVGAWI